MSPFMLTCALDVRFKVVVDRMRLSSELATNKTSQFTLYIFTPCVSMPYPSTPDSNISSCFNLAGKSKRIQQFQNYMKNLQISIFGLVTKNTIHLFPGGLSMCAMAMCVSNILQSHLSGSQHLICQQFVCCLLNGAKERVQQ